MSKAQKKNSTKSAKGKSAAPVKKNSKSAVKASVKMPARKDSAKTSKFADMFFAQVPAEDIAGFSAVELNLVAASMQGWAQNRKPGQHKLRVFNPDAKRDGWTVPCTVIQIVNDDMAFIIDSVTSELTYQGMNIDLLLHPILNASRDKSGALQDLQSGKAASAGYVTESMVHLHLEQTLSADTCEKLATALDHTLRDVRSATGDWRKMLVRIDDILGATDDFAKGHAAADVKEAEEFLAYIKANNFTFLGYRQYGFTSRKEGASLEVVKGSDLGVLKGGQKLGFGEDISGSKIELLAEARWPVMVSKLIEQYAAVHRRVPLDAVGVKILGRDGSLQGMHLFVGLFTSSTYSCRTNEVPIVRQKVAETIARAGFIKGSHDAKALEHILEKMPRDELFQASPEDVDRLSLGILRLQAKQRIALFTHMDPMKQYMSCLLYVPRDRYNTRFRLQAARILEHGYRGRVVNYFTTLDDSPLARLLFTVLLEDGAEEGYDQGYIEAQLIELGREWDERLKQVLISAHGRAKGSELAFTFGRAFTTAYHESIHVGNAVHDIRHLDDMVKTGEDIRVDFYRLQDMAAGEMHLKVYHRDTPVPLSDIMPVLGNMGLQAVSEMPYEVRPFGYNGSIWIHDFKLTGAEDIDLDAVKDNVESTFLHAWHGHAENDGLNQLALRANLHWRETLILRGYSGYMRQARFPYSRVYVEQVLSSYPAIARALVDFFRAMHDPKTAKKDKAQAAGDKIIDLLQDVQKLDHDRILRNFKMLIEHTLRTNFYQTDENGAAKPCLSFKLDSKNIDGIPLPRPHVEIFVYSARVEAVHLRGGEIARGGTRWSDRHDDFRTEILGLLKSQQVKNTVIVPVGAKGGFVVKQPPQTGGRDAYQQEGIACYKLFVQSLLDLTDNTVKGKIVRPQNVVFHDGVDPYLVMAADKGTATFSDIANGLSLDHGFWLADAFASGGSAGYDHKKMGITAKGGWESVKRHFREMGKDIQKEVFTVAGVGDMGGDVFGNAMLLSKQIKLQFAFNHVHIFCDPEPDLEKSFAERLRLFKNRGGWDAYDKSLLSTGGAIYERSAKSIKVSAQVKKLLGLDRDTLSPDDLMTAILKAEVELMWFGGIGTYIKSSRQSHADADDKSNDAVRIDGRDIRALVVGEGANLGCTQLGRIEYARKGGRINTDFIDNSAGVDCSDHEVNIKILLSDVMGRRKMSLPARNKLLESMTDDVSALVLRDNYQQTQALSLQEMLAQEHVNLHAELLRDLEKAGLIKRALEGLPDDETFARMARDGQGLTRPELSILMSYIKIVLYQRILASDIPDATEMESLLFEYFPKALQKYADEIRAHKLRREIIATQIVNTLVNRMGAVFVASRVAKTGEREEEVIKAFLVAQQAYGLDDIWQKIEALDNRVPSQVQISALKEVYTVVKRAVTWFLRYGGDNLDVGAEVEAFRPGIEKLRKSLRQMVPENVRLSLDSSSLKLAETGMPAAIAGDIAVIKLLSSASDIVDIGRKSKADVAEIAPAYFMVGERLGLDWLRQQASAIVPANPWQARVMGGLMDDFFIHQASITAAIFRGRKSRADAKQIEQWFVSRADLVSKIVQMVDELRAQPKVELEMLVLVSQRIGQLVHVV